MKLLIINGPNLNLLGTREPEIYGALTLSAMEDMIRACAAGCGCAADFFQSNCEGAIIDALHAAAGMYGGIIINPGAYSHYSYAIADALRAVPLPAVEVHLSNIAARERFRKISVTAAACVGSVSGLGAEGYLAAVRYLAASVNPL